MEIVRDLRKSRHGGGRLLIVGVILMACFGIPYYRTKNTAGKKALIWKALATSVAVAAAFVCTIENDGAAPLIVLAGTVLCVAADVLLELWLLAGVACFGMAHLCFITAFRMEGYFKSYTPVIFLILLGMMFVIFIRFFKELKWLVIPGVIYSFLLCGMTAVSVTGIASQGNLGDWFRGTGGLCFFVSDVILGWSTLTEKKGKGYGALVLLLYFPAVYLLAVSGY